MPPKSLLLLKGDRHCRFPHSNIKTYQLIETNQSLIFKIGLQSSWSKKRELFLHTQMLESAAKLVKIPEVYIDYPKVIVFCFSTKVELLVNPFNTVTNIQD